MEAVDYMFDKVSLTLLFSNVYITEVIIFIHYSNCN
jgi:hypothetical protein